MASAKRNDGRVNVRPPRSRTGGSDASRESPGSRMGAAGIALALPAGASVSAIRIAQPRRASDDGELMRAHHRSRNTRIQWIPRRCSNVPGSSYSVKSVKSVYSVILTATRSGTRPGPATGCSSASRSGCLSVSRSGWACRDKRFPGRRSARESRRPEMHWCGC